MVSDYYRGKAWQAGYDAGLLEQSKSTNTRKPGTIYFDDWCDGYADGERKRLASIKGSPHD